MIQPTARQGRSHSSASGVMGYHMAGHLAKAGHDVTVYNRTGSKAARWTDEFDGRRATTPAAAAAGNEIVFACVGNDDDVRSVTAGAGGAFEGMDAGAVFVDHTTASADVARELAAVAAERSLGFLDAPVSGGEAGAVNGGAHGHGGRRAGGVRIDAGTSSTRTPAPSPCSVRSAPVSSRRWPTRSASPVSCRDFPRR